MRFDPEPVSSMSLKVKYGIALFSCVLCAFLFFHVYVLHPVHVQEQNEKTTSVGLHRELASDREIATRDYGALSPRMHDLLQLRDALYAYYRDHRVFPKTAVNENIEGLVPHYLPALPHDPRHSPAAAEQYLYRSDGSEFKLVSSLPPDCKAVAAKAPEAIDPARESCSAYGFWTYGAENW